MAILKHLRNKLDWKTAAVVCILGVVVLLLYLPLTKTYYQQDEWLGLGSYMENGVGHVFSGTTGILSLVLAQGRILSNVIFYAFVKIYPFNIVPFAIFAIALHFLNTILIFLLAKKIFKNILPAFFGSLFFAVNGVSQGAVSWPATSINTLPSTTLILVALYFYFRYLDTFKPKWLIQSFLMVYLSLFFKETGVFLLLMLPVFSYFYKKQKIIFVLTKHWYFIVFAFLISIYRMWGYKSDSGQVALFLTGSSKYFFDSIIIRSFLYPLTSFSLSLVPPEPFLNFARYITNVYYPFIPEAQFILVAQTVVSDLLSLGFSALIGFILIPLLKLTDPKIRKNIIFWITFILASFIPYIIISKSYSYLESRYYYLAAAAWGIIFAWMFSMLFEKVKNIYIKIITIICFGSFIYIHAFTIHSDIKNLVTLSQTRIQVISQITKLQPFLTNRKNVFYITGDTDYLLPGNRVPFQQGFGYTLMTIYYNGGMIPKELLSDSFLFEIGSQGYKDIGDMGFGYYSDKKNLEIDVKRYRIPKESIYSFYYNSKSKTLTVTNDKIN